MNVDTTLSGIVTAVRGDFLELANGALTVDASSARLIAFDGDESVSIEAIHPGDYVFGIYTGSIQRAEHLPALKIAVRQLTVTQFGGIIQGVDNGITMLGRTIPIDGSTTFDMHVVFANGQQFPKTFRTFGPAPGDQIYVYLDPDGRAADVTRVWFEPPAPGKVIHGEIERITPDGWLIRGLDRADHNVLVNGATRVTIEPSIGRTVDALMFAETLTGAVVGDFESASGPVTAADDHTVTVGGFLTFDLTEAVVNNHEVIVPGDWVSVTYCSASLSPNAAIPAMFVIVQKRPPLELAGRVQRTGESSLFVAGRNITTDHSTEFCGGHSLADLKVGQQVRLTLRATTAGLIATEICEGSMAVPSAEMAGDIVRGVVTRVAGASWTICDVAGSDIVVDVNADTKLTAAPAVGDPVEVLTRSDVADAILPTGTSLWKGVTAFRGTVKDSSPLAFRIGPSGGMAIGPDYVMRILDVTKKIGAAQVGDVVELLYDRWVLSVRKAIPVEPQIRVRGSVSWSFCPREDGRPIRECGWSIATENEPEYVMYTAPDAKIEGDPKVGDYVTAIVTPNRDGFVIQSISKIQ